MKVWIVEMDRNYESNPVRVFYTRADAVTWIEAQGAVEEEGMDSWEVPAVQQPPTDPFWFRPIEFEVIEPTDPALTEKIDPDKLAP